RDEDLPFSYQRVRIHGRLPKRIGSHIRRAGSDTDSPAYDVTIADESGNVLVDITQYTLRRARAENFAVTIPAPGALDRLATIPAERRAPAEGEVEIEGAGA